VGLLKEFIAITSEEPPLTVQHYGRIVGTFKEHKLKPRILLSRSRQKCYLLPEDTLVPTGEVCKAKNLCPVSYLVMRPRWGSTPRVTN
jgi:hypothetical protein